MRAERNKILFLLKIFLIWELGILHYTVKIMTVEIMFFFKFNNALDTESFASIFSAPIAGKTGRHNYT